MPLPWRPSISKRCVRPPAAAEIAASRRRDATRRLRSRRARCRCRRARGRSAAHARPRAAGQPAGRGAGDRGAAARQLDRRAGRYRRCRRRLCRGVWVPPWATTCWPAMRPRRPCIGGICRSPGSRRRRCPQAVPPSAAMSVPRRCCIAGWRRSASSSRRWPSACRRRCFPASAWSAVTAARGAGTASSAAPVAPTPRPSVSASGKRLAELATEREPAEAEPPARGRACLGNRGRPCSTGRGRECPCRGDGGTGGDARPPPAGWLRAKAKRPGSPSELQRLTPRPQRSARGEAPRWRRSWRRHRTRRRRSAHTGRCRSRGRAAALPPPRSGWSTSRRRATRRNARSPRPRAGPVMRASGSSGARLPRNAAATRRKRQPGWPRQSRAAARSTRAALSAELEGVVAELAAVETAAAEAKAGSTIASTAAQAAETALEAARSAHRRRHGGAWHASAAKPPQPRARAGQLDAIVSDAGQRLDGHDAAPDRAGGPCRPDRRGPGGMPGDARDEGLEALVEQCAGLARDERAGGCRRRAAQRGRGRGAAGTAAGGGRAAARGARSPPARGPGRAGAGGKCRRGHAAALVVERLQAEPASLAADPEIAEALGKASLAEREARLARLRASRERLGPVNLRAEVEHRRVEEQLATAGARPRSWRPRSSG